MPPGFEGSSVVATSAAPDLHCKHFVGAFGSCTYAGCSPDGQTQPSSVPSMERQASTTEHGVAGSVGGARGEMVAVEVALVTVDRVGVDVVGKVGAVGVELESVEEVGVGFGEAVAMQ